MCAYFNPFIYLRIWLLSSRSTLRVIICNLQYNPARGLVCCAGVCDVNVVGGSKRSLEPGESLCRGGLGLRQLLVSGAEAPRLVLARLSGGCAEAETSQDTRITLLSSSWTETVSPCRSTIWGSRPRWRGGRSPRALRRKLLKYKQKILSKSICNSSSIIDLRPHNLTKHICMYYTHLYILHLHLSWSISLWEF